MKLRYPFFQAQKRFKATLSASVFAVCLAACGLTPGLINAGELGEARELEEAKELGEERDLEERDLEELNVLVSIKPLALLIAPLLSDKPQTPRSVGILLPAKASPHNYALKVSDRKRLLAADLVVWVGADMERFLQKPIAAITRANAKKSLAAMDVSAMHWPEPADDHDNKHQHHGLHDPHFWLNPQNAIALLEAVAKRLQVLNPSQQQIYQRRFESIRSKITESELKIVDILKNVHSKPFVVSHDGFGHFIARFALNQLAAIRINVDSKPGAKHLYELRKDIVRAGARCLLLDPGETHGWGPRLAKELNLQVASLDILAIEAEEMGYAEYIEGLAVTVESCLSEGL